MTTLRHRVRRHVDQTRLLDRYEALVALDTKIIDDLNAALDAQKELSAMLLRQQALENTRDMQALVCSWLIGLERPEVDMRDALSEMEHDLRDQIAQLEEHIL